MPPLGEVWKMVEPLPLGIPSGVNLPLQPMFMWGAIQASDLDHAKVRSGPTVLSYCDATKVAVGLEAAFSAFTI
jgi:hypothetical protein